MTTKYETRIRQLAQEYLFDPANNPWSGTVLENYSGSGPKRQGAFGEAYVQEHMETYHNSIVQPADCGPNGPYDRIIDSFNTEIKFTVAHKKRNASGEPSWAINHVAVGKAWERLIFCGMDLVNGVATPNLVWCTKEDFIDCRNETNLFTRQQNGKTGNNDDFMCLGAKPLQWMNSRFARKMSEWN